MNDDETGEPGEPSEPEGVRIIGADEAAEALERDDVARRREPGTARPGVPASRPPASSEPVLRFPLSSSGSTEPVRAQSDDLPHWTEPPAGGGPDDVGEAADDDWATFTGGTPRWRDDSDEGADDDAGVFGADDTPLGALDESDRPDPDDFFSFDEIDPPPGRSVFAAAGDEDDYDDDPYDESDADDFDEPTAPGPRKIVVGGGRVSPGGPGRSSSTAIGADRDLGQAALVGIGFLAVAAVLFYAGPAWATILVLGVVTVAAAEFFTAVRRVGYKPAALLGIAGTAALVLAGFHRGEAGLSLVLFLIVAFSLLWYLVGADEGQATLNIGVTLLGVGWIGFFGAYASVLLSIRGGADIGDAGKGILFGAILCTAGYDTGGYFVGRSAGRSPLSAASPNKTVEGLAGGVIVALLVGVVYGFLSEPFGSLGDGLKLGLVVAVVAPLGDLCQSMIKRDLGIKDMGSVLPGHGGLLDRFDALLFVLPAVYYAARYFDFFL